MPGVTVIIQYAHAGLNQYVADGGCWGRLSIPCSLAPLMPLFSSTMASSSAGDVAGADSSAGGVAGEGVNSGAGSVAAGAGFSAGVVGAGATAEVVALPRGASA